MLNVHVFGVLQVQPAGTAISGTRQGLQTTLTGLHLHGAVFDSAMQLALSSQMMDSCAVDLQVHPRAVTPNTAPAYVCSVYGCKRLGGEMGARLLELPLRLPASLLASQCQIHGIYLRCQL